MANKPGTKEHTMNANLAARITTLRDEAATHGDLEMVAICGRALAGDLDALAECAGVMADAAAMDDGDNGDED